MCGPDDDDDDDGPDDGGSPEKPKKNDGGGGNINSLPSATHDETVCLLSKLHEAKYHINVKVLGGVMSTKEKILDAAVM